MSSLTESGGDLPAERQSVLLQKWTGLGHVDVALRGSREPVEFLVCYAEVDLAEEVFETTWRNEFEDTGGFIARVPEGVPLTARFEDQVARFGKHLDSVEDRSELAF